MNSPYPLPPDPMGDWEALFMAIAVFGIVVSVLFITGVL